MSPAGRRRNTGQWYSHWCVLLDFHLQRKRMSGQRFAHLVGISQQMVHSYATGKTRPPLDLVPQWANKLELNRGEASQFLEAAFEAHTPEPIWARLVALESGSMPPAQTDAAAKRRSDLCQAALADTVGILKEVEEMFYLRLVPFEMLRQKRETLGVAVRAAIERYSRAPA
jgi:transcriptional regulator with XRE-family HTH domain